MAQVVGIELADSGTRLSAARGTQRGGRRWSVRLSEPPSADEAIRQMHDLIERALREDAGGVGGEASAVAIGVAVAGEVDAARGVVRSVPLAAGWEQRNLGAALAQRWGGAVAIRSTTQAATLAEARVGAGQPFRDVLYLQIGRSVAAGWMLEERPRFGAHGEAGNLAHCQVRVDGPRCACGGRGHLETVASAQSIVRTMIGRAVDHPESSAAMLRVTGGRAEAMTAAQVARLAAKGDLVAASVLGEALDALASVVAPLVSAMDPEAVILGGPLVQAGRDVLDPLEARLRERCVGAGGMLRVLAGELEPDPALIGAVIAAQEAGRVDDPH